MRGGAGGLLMCLARAARGLAILIALSAGAAYGAERAPTIAAAADLKFALEEVADRFARDTGRAVTLSFGSSGNLYRQITQGAPFEMFLSADEDFVYRLAAAGKAEDEGVLYAIGRIVLLVPEGSPLEPDAAFADLKRALADGRVKRFAIANPEHAPYGRRAREALEKAGLWAMIHDKLVLGENVAQAAHFALSGSAQGGIVAYSLALAPPIAAGARFALIPEAWHEPLRQRMVLIKGAGPTARLFYAYMQEPEARTIMRKYGFVLPGESA